MRKTELILNKIKLKEVVKGMKR